MTVILMSVEIKFIQRRLGEPQLFITLSSDALTVFLLKFKTVILTVFIFSVIADLLIVNSQRLTVKLWLQL